MRQSDFKNEVLSIASTLTNCPLQDVAGQVYLLSEEIRKAHMANITVAIVLTKPERDALAEKLVTLLQPHGVVSVTKILATLKESLPKVEASIFEL